MAMLAKLIELLRGKLSEAVRANLADGLLLSGGLDTSILACLASRYSDPLALTVSVGNSPDLMYARRAAKLFGLRHHIIRPGLDEYEAAAGHVIRELKTFDTMEVRGGTAVYLALLKAKELGLSSLMTGDGGDELFAGYSFYLELDRRRLISALRRTWRGMRFSSIPLAQSLGLRARLPYLHEELKRLAMGIDPSLKVRKEGSGIWGKWILRKAFEDLITPELAWRPKLHISAGSGIDLLAEELASGIDVGLYGKLSKHYAEQDAVRLRDAEQLVYYRHFRKAYGPPANMGRGSKLCPACRARARRSSVHCRFCGAYPI
ncbi:MAG: hypothetical protein C4339_02880 [Nitrososphaerota archaeon]